MCKEGCFDSQVSYRKSSAATGCALASCGESILAPHFRSNFALTLLVTSAALTTEKYRLPEWFRTL